MKKITALVLVAVMLVGACFALSSCGGKTKLKFGTGGTAGTYYAFGGVLSNVVNTKSDKIEVSVISSGASKANILDVVAGTSDIALVQNDVMSYAYTGTDLFEKDGAIKDFRTVAALYAEVCQIVADGSIASIADLKGKKVSVGDAGSGVEFNAKQILAAYGIDMDKDITKVNKDFDGSQQALAEGTIDAFFCTAGVPTTAITTLSTTKSINMLEVDDEHLDVLHEAGYGFYARYVIPKGTYGLENDVKGIAVKATLIAAAEISEDAIYELVSQIFGNKDEIKNAHAKGAELDLDYAVNDLTVPFHAGAIKFFTEKGYKFDENGLLTK